MERSYHVQVTTDPIRFFRVVRGGRLDATSFMSNREMGFACRNEEDWGIYQSVSVRRTLKQALSVGRAIEKAQKLAKSSLQPPSHMALFEVRGSDGHAFAKTLFDELPD